MPRLRFAGQITGVEGYLESAACGLLAGRFAAAEHRGETHAPPPPTTALGALLAHITGGAADETFQPMNVNFGLFPSLEVLEKNQRRRKGRRERRAGYTLRALTDLGVWLGDDQAATELSLKQIAVNRNHPSDSD